MTNLEGLESMEIETDIRDVDPSQGQAALAAALRAGALPGAKEVTGG